MTLPSSLRGRVLAAAEASPSPGRSAVAAGRRRAAATAAIVALVIFFTYGGARLGDRPAAFVVLVALGWALCALGATAASIGRGRSMTGRPSSALVTLALATAPVLFAWHVAAQAGWPRAFAPAPFLRTLACLIATIAMAAGPFAAFLWVRRESDPVHPRALGAACGAAAGAWGAVLIELHCPLGEAGHVALSHALPLLLLSLLGALVGRRVLGLR